MERLWKKRQDSMKNKFKGCNLIVKNLPKSITEQELRNLFKPFGEVTSVKISTQGVMKDVIRNNVIVDKEFIYESKGYGYICFKTDESAKEVGIPFLLRLKLK